jgi:transposase
MAVIALSSAGRRALEAIVARPRESRPYRRAHASLWLAEGERPTAVAQRLRVHRETIDAWAKRYRERRPPPVATRLRDRARPGRPRHLAERVARGFGTAIETAPHAQGYRAAQWATPVLRHYLRAHQALAVRCGDGATRPPSPGLPLEAPPLCARPTLAALAPGQRGLTRG